MNPISGALANAVMWTVIAFQLLIVVVLAGLLCRRVLLSYWKRYAEKRKLYFQAHVLNLLEDPLSISPLNIGLRPFDKGFIEQLLLQQAGELEGQQREDMTAVFEKLGYVAAERRTIGARAWWQRNDGVIKLGVMRSQDAVPSLVKAVSDNSEIVRLSAIRALGQMKYKEGLKTVLGVLGETEKWTGARVLEILVGTGDLVKEDVLSLLASVTEPRHRRLLIELCGIKKWSEAFPILIPFLRDSEATTRVSVTRALSSMSVPAAGDYLITALKDTCWEVRAEAAKGLGIVQNRQAASALLMSLADPNWWVRYNSANAVSKLGAAGIASLREVSRRGEEPASGMATQVLAEQNLYAY